MFIFESRIATDNAEKYLAQLCKHFRHKVPAEYEGSRGQVDFQPGSCRLMAEDGALIIYCETDDEQNVGRLKFIFEDHLKRFAWRENINIEWREIA